MKRKIFLCFLLVGVSLMFFGCGNNILKLVKDNMSEITEVYYYAEKQNFSVSISYGKRENEYITDGKSEDKVDFCLLSLNLKETSKDEIKTAKIIIDDNETSLELLRNPKNGAYMVDIEKKLSGSEKIDFIFENKSTTLQALSNDFKINHNKALEIAVGELEKEINKEKSYNNLNGECYLRVLNKDVNNLTLPYWCFTVFNTKGEDFSVIISTEDGSILAKTE